MLSDDVISEIRERVDMVTLVSEYVRLTKRGTNHIGLCPFHAEKTPSFNVSAAHKFFHCFGCKESGDAFSFVMRMEGIAFPQAARALAERVGVQLPESDHAEDAAERRERQRRERQLAVMEDACAFYERELERNAGAQVARDELGRRTITAATAGRFRLGYAPHGWDALATFLAQKGHSPADAEDVGLIAKRREGNGHYDRFRGRLMFPVRELGGKVIAFSGRVLPAPTGEPPGPNDPKYVNSAEGPLYSKGQVLYGLHESRVEVRRHGWAILCEGNFDLLALHQAGFGNALAPMGTAFTQSQAKLLGRFAERVTLLFDGDNAGKKAVRVAFPVLSQQGLRAAVAELPTGQDPDSFLRARGAEGLQGLLSSAQGIVEYLIDSAAADAGPSAAERAAAVGALAPVLEGVTNAVELELCIERVVQRFGLPNAGAVRRLLRQSSQPARSQQAPRSTLAESNDSVRLPGLRRDLLGIVLDRPALLAGPEARELESLLTDDPDLMGVLRAARALAPESGALDSTALLSALGDNPALPWLRGRLVLQTYRDNDDAEHALRMGIAHLSNRDKERRLARLREEITQARKRGDAERAVQLTKERIELERTASKQLRRER